MKVWYLVSTKAKGLRFKIVKLNKETRSATLQGDTGVPFDHDISQATLDKLGYKVEVVEEAETENV